MCICMSEQILGKMLMFLNRWNRKFDNSSTRCYFCFTKTLPELMCFAIVAALSKSKHSSCDRKISNFK